MGNTCEDIGGGYNMVSEVTWCINLNLRYMKWITIKKFSFTVPLLTKMASQMHILYEINLIFRVAMLRQSL